MITECVECGHLHYDSTAREWIPCPLHSAGCYCGGQDAHGRPTYCEPNGSIARRVQGAETTASEQRPPTTPHITPGLRFHDPDKRPTLSEQHNQDTDGHGEPVDEQRRRLPDTAPLDKHDHRAMQEGYDADGEPFYLDTSDHHRAAQYRLDELRFRITPRGFNALTEANARLAFQSRIWQARL